ncbi:hypothetical protein SZ54_2995 [Rhizobium sp. UR51a]|nr:hypothetical protein SZ54_2995 [Rhizobium sp. UR51a]
MLAHDLQCVENARARSCMGIDISRCIQPVAQAGYSHA